MIDGRWQWTMDTPLIERGRRDGKGRFILAGKLFLMSLVSHLIRVSFDIRCSLDTAILLS